MAAAWLPCFRRMNSAAQLVSNTLPRASGTTWKFPPYGWRRKRRTGKCRSTARRRIIPTPERREGRLCCSSRPAAGWLVIGQSCSASPLGRSSKVSCPFGLFQGSLQHDRQHRLANEIDRLIGLKSHPRRLIQVGAEKYAPQRLARVELPGRIDAACPAQGECPSEPHRDCVRSLRQCSSRRRRSRAHFVAELCNQHCKVHGDDGVVFDDENPQKS